MIDELSQLIKAEARLWFDTGDLCMSDSPNAKVLERLTNEIERITKEIVDMKTGTLPNEQLLLPGDWD